MFNGVTINTSEWAHVIIDVQKNFCSAAKGQEEAEQVAQNIAVVKASLAKLKLATYIVYFSNYGQDHTNSSGGLHIIEPTNGDVIVPKTRDFMVKGGDILTLLKDGGHKSLLVSGFNRGYCVADSVVDSLKNGLEVTVMEDCVGHMKHQASLPTHKRAYDTMRKSGAQISCSQAILSHLSRF